MTKAVVSAVATVALALLAVGSARAASMELDPIQDTTIFSSDPGAGNGAGVNLFVGNTLRSAGVRRSLLLFDISGIPAGSTIDAVTLTMKVDQVSEQAAFPLSLHRVLASWGEGTAASQGGGGAAAGNADATWTRRFHLAGPDWDMPGGDHVVDASASTAVGSVGTYQWSSATMAADVQGWLDSTSGNAGWILIGDEISFGSAKRFLSSENGVAVDRPRLTVAYTSPVPEPRAYSLMLCASVLLAWAAYRRRNRSD